MNAPERIWVEPDYDHGWTYPRGEWSIACPWPHADAVEYVRADRIAAMEAERDDYREKWVRDTGKLAVYAEQQEDRAHRLEAEVARLREALVKIEAQTDIVSDRAWADKLRDSHLRRMLALAHTIARAALPAPPEGEQ